MGWLGSLLWQQGTRLRAAATTDRFGSKRLDWGAGSSLSLPLALDQRSVVEQTAGDQRVIVKAKVFADTGADIVATDRVVVDGVTWDVVGVVPRAFRGLAHVEVHVQRTGEV